MNSNGFLLEFGFQMHSKNNFPEKTKMLLFFLGLTGAIN